MYPINKFLLLFFAMAIIGLNSAFALENKKNWKDQINRYELELAANPNSAPALKGLAKAYAYSGQYNSALEVYNRLLELYPEDIEGLIGRARVYAWQGEYELGEADLRKILDQDTDNADAWHALGDLLLWSGKVRQSAKAYTSWQALEPDQPDAWLGAARANMSARRYGAAWKDLQRARSRGANYAVISEMRRTLARVPNSHKWETGTIGLYRFLEDDYNRTGESGQGYLRHDWSNGSFLFRGLWSRDADKEEDIAASVEFNINISWRSYITIWGFQALQDPDLLPENAFRFIWHQGLWRGLEVNGGFQYTQMPESIFRVYIAQGHYYWGRWRIGGDYLISNYAENDKASFSTRIKRELQTIDDYFEFGYEYRNYHERYDDLYMQTSDESIVYTSELQWFLGRHFGINLRYEYIDYKNSPTAVLARGGLRLRW